MPNWEGKRRIAIVTACMCPDGTPDFAFSEVEVTEDEYANGVHYYHAEADLLESGREEPFVHFDELESPRFLHAAVKQHLALPIVIPFSAHQPPEKP